MSVAIDETRNDSFSPQVYDFRRRSCQLTDLVTPANSDKLSICDSERFSDTELLVYGYNLAIDEYRIGETRRKNIRCRNNSA
jgi:hypothetical protein